MIKTFASMPVLIALSVAAHALPLSDAAPDNSTWAEHALKPASDTGPLQRFAQDERQQAIQRAIQQRQQQQQNQQRAIQQQMQQRGVQQQQMQQRAIQQQQQIQQQRAIQQQQIQQRANQQQQQIQQQRAIQQQQIQQRAIQEQRGNQQRALQQQQIQQQAIQQRAIQQQMQQRGVQQQQLLQQRGIQQQQAIQQNAVQQRMLQQQQALQQRALQQQMMQQRINAARITRGPGQIAVGRPNYTNLQLARLNAGRVAPIYRAPRRYWYGGGWRTYVPLAALGAVAVGGAYLYADAYVPVGRRYCEGVTADGCQLNWQMVEFEGGGADWQCVQYCPRAGALPPPRTVALTAPPPPAEGKCEISLYAGPNFSNGPVTTSEDQPQLSASGWRNQIASLQIAAGTWDVFTDEQFGGESARLEPGDYPNLPPQFERNIGSFTCVQPSP